MTLVQRTVNVIEHFEELFKNKFFKTLFLTVCVSFLVFSTFNAYAIDWDMNSDMSDLTGYKLSTDSSWVSEQEFTNLGQGVEVGSEDITTMQNNSLLATLQNIGLHLCPDCFENGEAIQASTTLPETMKLGLLGMTENGVMAMLNNPPSVDVPSHLASEWIPGYNPSNTSTYAVGGHLSGYKELQLAGVDVIWGRVRNITYVMFVIIMIVIGFMIMFRNKIGGQTMVTVGNAIPNVIIALVLVTFSFAIAGLIIDLGGLILIFLASILGGGPIDDYSQFTTIGNPFKVTWIAFSGKGNLTATTMGLAATVGVISGGIAAANQAASDAVGTAVSLGANSAAKGLVVGGLATMLVWLVVIGIVGYGAIKLWFMLLKSYLTILIQVIAAPLIIMTAALPGNMKAFTNWMKGIAKNVLVFPATFALINLPNALYSISDDIRLRLPGALIFEDPEKYTADGFKLGSQLFVAILEVILIYVASQIPAFLETILPSNSSPAMQKAGEKSKEALSKMPIVGSLFGGK